MAKETEAKEPVDLDRKTGGIHITIAETTFDLRAPTFGEVRDLLTAAEKQDEQTERQSTDTVRENIEWWRSTIKLLSGEEAPLVESCPFWLGSPALVTRATQHWLTVPTLAPGN